tara:strand:+ start:48 stop:686 length:639 start_codon:yes stop_codon:yes gene_type:complete
VIKARDLVISPCVVSEVRGFIESYHYSKSINGVKVTQCFKVEYLGKLVGAALFGQLSTTAWKKFGQSEVEVLELRRLALIDECGKNSESRVIGSCLKWVKVNLCAVNVIVSYADPMYGHSGVVYKATNFEFIGVTPDDTGFYDPDLDKTYHSRAMRTKYKGEYKPFVKRLRAKMEAGLLIERVLKGKLCYVYRFNRRNREARCVLSGNGDDR